MHEKLFSMAIPAFATHLTYVKFMQIDQKNSLKRVFH